MMEFSDATGLHRITVGTRVIVKAVAGFFDMLVTRAYWDISESPGKELISLRGKSGKHYDGVSPKEVAVCLEYFGEYYIPVSFVGDDFLPGAGMMVLVWSDKFHQMAYCEVMARDSDIVQLRYGKGTYEKKTIDCYVSLSDFREAHKQM